VIRISTTPAILNHNVQKPIQDIVQKKADLDIKQVHSKVRVEGTLPKIRIDQSQCFDEAGLKTPLNLTYANSDYARQQMLQAIGRIAEQGDELSNVHKRYNAIATQAYQNAYGQFEFDWNIDYIPKSRPKIDLIEGQLDIKVEGGTVQNDTRINAPQINYTPGKVSFYLKQQNSITMEYEPDKK
jgi:hypothetical protein